MELGEFGAALSDFVIQYGYWAVFLMIFLESAGVPLPGETTLIAASIFSAATHDLDISLIISAAAAGAILGDNLGYWVGHHYGMRLLSRYGHYVHLSEDRLKIGTWLFQKYGGRVVFFGRFTAFLRTYAALLAGALNFPPRQFFLWNASGGIAWAVFFGLGGHLFGHAIKAIAGPLSTALFIGVVAGIVGLVWMFKRQEAHLLAQAEAALTTGKHRR
jgi:membrane protein DedA with SNARE-associated domain